MIWQRRARDQPRPRWADVVDEADSSAPKEAELEILRARIDDLTNRIMRLEAARSRSTTPPDAGTGEAADHARAEDGPDDCEEADAQQVSHVTCDIATPSDEDLLHRGDARSEETSPSARARDEDRSELGATRELEDNNDESKGGESVALAPSATRGSSETEECSSVGDYVETHAGADEEAMTDSDDGGGRNEPDEVSDQHVQTQRDGNIVEDRSIFEEYSDPGAASSGAWHNPYVDLSPVASADEARESDVTSVQSDHDAEDQPLSAPEYNEQAAASSAAIATTQAHEAVVDGEFVVVQSRSRTRAAGRRARAAAFPPSAVEYIASHPISDARIRVLQDLIAAHAERLRQALACGDADWAADIQSASHDANEIIQIELQLRRRPGRRLL